MENKVIKYTSDLFQQEVTLIVVERLNKIDEKKNASKKLVEANKALKGVKLPQ